MNVRTPRTSRTARTAAITTSALLGGALLAIAPLAWSQSSVQIYGIVDAAIRHTTNEGAAGDGSLTQMIGGGMSQSRWGINVTEDLGGGLRALANLENRFGTDTGAQEQTGGSLASDEALQALREKLTGGGN